MTQRIGDSKYNKYAILRKTFFLHSVIYHGGSSVSPSCFNSLV